MKFFAAVLLSIFSVVTATAQDLFVPFFSLSGFTNTIGNGLSNSLAAYWRFEETTGNALDSSGNGRTLTANDNPSSVTGIVANARSYVKTGEDFFWRTNDAAFAFENGQMSITAWVQFYQQFPDTDDMTVLSRGDWGGGGGTNFSWWLFLDHGEPDDYMYFVFSTNGTFDLANSVQYFIEGGVDGNLFYFIAVRWSGTSLQISVTPADVPIVALDSSVAFAGPFFAGTAALTVGDEDGTGSGIHQMEGIIDEVGIWNLYLSDCQLNWLFTAKNGTFTATNFDAAITCDTNLSTDREWDVPSNAPTFDVTTGKIIYSIH